MERLENALRKSVSASMGSGGRTAILFSGGLDSAVLAFLAKKSGADPLLICAGMAGSEDVRIAQETAQGMGMRLAVREIRESELPSLCSRTREISGERDFMKVELGALFLSCCETAEKLGIRFLVSGSGAEELFLGYSAHSLKHKSGADLDSIRMSELAGLYEKDIRRTERIAEHFKMRALLPYLDENVMHAVLAIPASENFKKGENKAVLRALARKIGVPESACSRPKRAMQYGSGIHSRLMRLKKIGEF